MATEYTVALRDGVSGPADKAAASARKLRSALLELEEAKASVGLGGRGSGGVRGGADRSAAAAARAAAQQVKAAERAQAQITRDEMRFSAYRLRLNRQEHMQRDRAEKAALRSHLKYIKERQRAEDRAAKAKAARRQKIGGAVGGVAKGIAATVVAGGLATLGYAANQGVDTAKLIENAKMRLTAQLGSAEAANTEIKDAFRIATKTIFDPEETLEALTQLSTNFKQGDIRRYVFGAISDFATFSGKGNEGMQRSIVAINQIMAKGRLQQEELTGQLSELGINAGDVYTELAKIMKVTGKDQRERNDKVIKLITAGKVDGNTAVQALTQVMRNFAGGGPAGSAAVQAADTIESKISNIKKGLMTLYALSDIGSWPALIEFKKILGQTADTFDYGSESGQNLTEALKIMANAAVPVVKLIKDLWDMGVTLTKSTTLMMLLGKGIAFVVKLVVLAVAAVGLFIGAIAVLVGAVDVALDAIIGFFSSAYDLGANFVAGLVNGIKSGVGKIWEAASGIASTAVAAIKEKLHISSPSRVAMKMGNQTGEGFAIGIERSARGVSQSAAALPAAAVSGMSSSQGMSAARGQGGVTFVQNNTFQVTGADAEDIASRAIMKAKTEFRTFAEQYFAQQLAMGGA